VRIGAETFQGFQLEELVELNRGLRRHPNQTAPERERAVVELRQAHMRWGRAS